MNDIYNLRKFLAPEFIFGEDSRKLIGQYAKKLGGRTALIVTDEGLISAGWIEEIKEYLKNERIKYVVFSQVTPSPKTEEVEQGAVLYQEKNCNIVIAVGGGSVIDCAKGIGIIAANRRSVLDFVGVDRIRYPIPPLICLPSTPGTGADISQFAILKDMQKLAKVGIISKAIVPDLSLIDPIIVATIPKYHLNCSLMDCLSHAIEAYVSTGSSVITELNALDAIKRASKIIDSGVVSPHDSNVVNEMTICGFEAGIAFSNASLGLVHAMSHSFEGLTDTSHGESISIFLEAVIDFNYDAIPHKYNIIGKNMGLELESLNSDQKKYAVIEKIRKLKKISGFDKKMKDYGLSLDNIPFLTQNTLNDLCLITNPRKPARHDIERLYKKVL